MANQPTYIWAILFACIAMFLVWLCYKILVPVFNMTIAPIATQYPALVGNDPTYVAGFNTITSQTNILFQYDFPIMGLGIVSVFVIIFAYRTVFGSTQVGYQQDDSF